MKYSPVCSQGIRVKDSRQWLQWKNFRAIHQTVGDAVFHLVIRKTRRFTSGLIMIS
jgi:hypothetical protein